MCVKNAGNYFEIQLQNNRLKRLESTVFKPLLNSMSKASYWSSQMLLHITGSNLIQCDQLILNLNYKRQYINVEIIFNFDYPKAKL